MKKRRGKHLLGIMLAALALLVLVLFGRLLVHRPHEVALAEPDDSPGGETAQPDDKRETVRRVEVTPRTVQLVIERLARPENYSRAITVERFWDGGSGVSEITVRAANGWTRVDTASGENRRHVVTGDGKCWIWYGDRKVYSAQAALTADEEQSIPTYEDILQWDPSRIAVADYREYEGVDCIYVETAPDGAGLVERDWVSVDSGLLIAMERAGGEDTVCRMSALAVEQDTVTAEAFTLPNGTVLYDPNAAEDGENGT